MSGTGTNGTIAIVGGEVLDHTGRRRADVVIDGDTIVAVDVGLRGDHQLDASGCLVVPGLVDLHAHLRQPGHEEAETIETASRAAALGGFTAVVAMPDTDPCADSAGVVREVLELGRAALCEIVPAGAITHGREGETLAPMSELAELGVRLFTDDGRGVADARVMRRALEYAVGVSARVREPIVVAQHADDPDLAEGACMHEGGWSSRLGLPGQPAEAEELMVMRDIALARLTGARVHFQHLSSAGSVAMVRAARAGGLAITAEVTPHHLVLTDAACAGYDTACKVAPPLRTEADRAALRAALADGTVDAVATDHAPWSSEDKEQPFADARPGAIGLETALAVALTELDLPVETIVGALSWRPAAIAGLAGRHGGPIEPDRWANLCVVDPEAAWTVRASESASSGRFTPFEGRTLTGRVRHTVHRGEPVVVDGVAAR